MQQAKPSIEHMEVEAPADTSLKSWIDRLDEAVSNTDEPAIWRLMDEQSGNDSAHEALTSLVSRLAYVHHERNVFCELFMLPVIAMQGCNVIDNAQVWKGVRNQVREALGRWFNDDGRATLFDDIAPMDWVTTWRPGVLRAHLERLIPGCIGPHSPRNRFLCLTRPRALDSWWLDAQRIRAGVTCPVLMP